MRSTTEPESLTYWSSKTVTLSTGGVELFIRSALGSNAYRAMRSSVSYLLRCSIALVLSLGIFLFSLPIYVDIPTIAILLLLAMLAPLANLAILSLSLLVSLSGAALVISARFPPEQQHYREHEKYMRGDRYARNVSDVIDMPHGDLLAIEPALAPVLAEPRRVSFQTDSAGYRNQEDYSDQKFVLNGDSFVVGNGLDQADTIGEVLRRDFGLHTYSIAFASGPTQYDDRAWAFLQEHGSGDFVFATFVYEGNDFEALELKGLHRSSPLIAHRIADILDWYDGYKAWVFNGLPYVPKFSRTAFALGRQCERLFCARTVDS